MYILDAYVSEDLALFLGKTLNLIHIAAPILLIVFVTIDLIKAILSQDNEIVSKTVKNWRIGRGNYQVDEIGK